MVAPMVGAIYKSRSSSVAMIAPPIDAIMIASESATITSFDAMLAFYSINTCVQLLHNSCSVHIAQFFL